MEASSAVAAASLFLISQGNVVDTTTVPYLEAGVDPYATHETTSQTAYINKDEYACEAFGEYVATTLTTCPKAKIETMESTEFGMVDNDLF